VEVLLDEGGNLCLVVADVGTQCAVAEGAELGDEALESVAGGLNIDPPRL